MEQLIIEYGFEVGSAVLLGLVGAIYWVGKIAFSARLESAGLRVEVQELTRIVKNEVPPAQKENLRVIQFTEGPPAEILAEKLG